MTIDHVTNGLNQLPSQFQDSPIFKELVKIYLEEVQEIEDCVADIQLQKNLDFAVGYQLDVIGENLGKRREGLDDSTYRETLRIQRVINAGEGQFDTALLLWKNLTGSNTATLYEDYPAGISLYSDVGAPPLYKLNLFTNSLPITVTASITSSYSADDAFCFAGGVGSGFGTTGDSSIGGELISRYTNII